MLDLDAGDAVFGPEREARAEGGRGVDILDSCGVRRRLCIETHHRDWGLRRLVSAGRWRRTVCGEEVKAVRKQCHSRAHPLVKEGLAFEGGLHVPLKLAADFGSVVELVLRKKGRAPRLGRVHGLSQEHGGCRGTKLGQRHGERVG